MKVIEVDPQTFMDINPPAFSQLKIMIMNALENIHDKKGVLFALKENGTYLGRVMAFTDSSYASYGGKVGSFGWIHGNRTSHFKLLLDEVENYLSSQDVNLVRGPRNEPVIIGGQGVLVHGFNMPELIGVPENEYWLGKRLQKCKYDYDTQYYCIKWTAPFYRWTEKEDPDISLINLEFDEIVQRADEIATLYNGCMANMPDMTELDKNIVINFAQFFQSIDALDYLFFAIFDDKIVGLAVLIPNIYDIWSGYSIQDVNWYVADVSKDYRGRFIFSKMKNMVMNLLDKKQIPAYEGTYIWDGNQHMLDMCLRTGKLVRKHLIFSKELNGGI